MNTKQILYLAVLAGLLLGGKLHAQIFVTNGNNTITEYTTTGAPVGTGVLVSRDGMDAPIGIAIENLPEPSSWAMIAIGGAGLLTFTIRRRIKA